MLRQIFPKIKKIFEMPMLKCILIIPVSHVLIRNRFDELQIIILRRQKGDVGGYSVLQSHGHGEFPPVDPVCEGKSSQFFFGILEVIRDFAIDIGVGLDEDLAVLLSELEGLIDDFELGTHGDLWIEQAYVFGVAPDAAMADESSDSPGHGRAMNAVSAGGEFHHELTKGIFGPGRHHRHAVLCLKGLRDIPGRIGSFFDDAERSQRAFPSLVSDTDGVGLNGGGVLIEKVQSQFRNVDEQLLMLGRRKDPEGGYGYTPSHRWNPRVHPREKQIHLVVSEAEPPCDVEDGVLLAHLVPSGRPDDGKFGNLVGKPLHDGIVPFFGASRRREQETEDREQDEQSYATGVSHIPGFPQRTVLMNPYCSPSTAVK